MGWIADDLMPMLDRKLACHHGRATAMANQEFDARQSPEKASMAAVAAREGERVDQPRQPVIEHGAVVPAGLVA